MGLLSGSKMNAFTEPTCVALTICQALFKTLHIKKKILMITAVPQGRYNFYLFPLYRERNGGTLFEGAQLQ
jgi:hypothetical protein